MFLPSPTYAQLISFVPEIFDRESASEVPQDLQKHPGPVGTVAEFAEVWQRFLWTPNSALYLAQLVTERDQ